MMGADLANRDLRGVIPRIVEHIFAHIATAPGHMEYTVKVSYMEIYMERIRDLLQPVNDNLPIHEDKARGVYVKGLVEVYVQSLAEVNDLLALGGQARAVSSTNMNAESSRSHSILLVTITQKNLETGSAKMGQLNLVDLAGSEKVGKTGASGQTLEEAKKINKSLSALGMVINALTDGKSTHVPYRDSKLTRILQESLGGNSRTTLIINCSPSAFNDAETLSTLRFGMRAKSIKNKAKINAEMSPAELKAQLRKARSEVVTYQEYASLLETAVGVWRRGGKVEPEKWAKLGDGTPLASVGLNRHDSSQGSDAMSTRTMTPMPGTVVLDKDEREDFLKRENELQDQLSEKESFNLRQEKLLETLRNELETLRVHDAETSQQLDERNAQFSEVKMNLEKATFERKETYITMDSLKDANNELTAELDEVKKSLMQAKLQAASSSGEMTAEEKEKRKADKMKYMMASFDATTPAGGQRLDELVRSLEAESLPAETRERVLKTVAELREVVGDAELGLYERNDTVDILTRRKEDVEERLRRTQQEYQELLEKTLRGSLDDSDVDVLKGKFEDSYQQQLSSDRAARDDLKAAAEKNAEEVRHLRATVKSLQRGNAEMTNGNGHLASSTNGGRTVAQQVADFDVMKKSLMRDLQSRCERVVELEIALDEMREGYNTVLRNTNSRAQQKKMAFLERNLEQLTSVQRQLVEQNASLKKEVAIAERKLIARNERIVSLESLLQDAQSKLQQQNARFETQLATVRERLEAAKNKSATGGLMANGLGNSTVGGGAVGAFSSFFGGGGGGATTTAKIAKPLRGGGSEQVPSSPLSPVVNARLNDAGSTTTKRSSAGASSWFSRG